MSVPNEARPLEGLRVVDWTHVLAGPFSGYQLSLLGADVIRIERPQGDDLIRSSAADAELAALGLGETFITQGGGKRSLAIDAKDPRGRAALTDLIASADVLLENFRPGKLAALGFDPTRLIEQNPRLVVCSITGFGPASGRRAYDHVVQAASGLMNANKNAVGQPQRVGFPLVDYAVGQQAAMAVIAALYRRDARRHEPRVRGEWLQVTMQGAALTLMGPAYAELIVSGMERPRSASTAFSGNPLSGTFQAEDGWLAIVCNAKDQTDGLLLALEEAGANCLTMDRLHAVAEKRDVAAAQEILGSLLRSRTTADWEARFSNRGVPATAVRTPAQAAAEASIQWPRVRLPATSSKPEREVAVPGIGFSSTLRLSDEVLRTPARRGQDTRAVLTELGWSTTAIDQIVADGAAAESFPVAP